MMMNTKDINKVWRQVTSILLFYLFAFLPFPVSAQKLIVQKTTVDVGRTGWQKPITAVFDFTVKGSRKVRIESVQPDCYCTAVDYPKGDLSGKFQIKMTYDAKQLGHFDKQAAIKTSASANPLYIRMKGQVLEHYVDLSGSYPIEMGDLRLDRNSIEFDDANKGDQQVQVLNVYNHGTKNYTPHLLHLPPYLTATMMPELLRPGEEGKMTITLSSSKLHDYGLTQTSVYLAGTPGDKVSPDHEIDVSAVLLPPFSQPTEYSPAIKLSKETVDFVFENKTKKSEVIEIVNTGRSELLVSSLQMFTPGLRISLSKSRLMPGETAKLKITAMRDDLKKVRTRPRILMITNDPAKSKVTITINVK